MSIPGDERFAVAETQEVTQEPRKDYERQTADNSWNAGPMEAGRLA
ncbi:MAG: hypothetical protein J0I10_09330 [Verrucomicrobia bacterium]|nr:hypothetical protein [Verrucomicrobiota bacterium]